MTYFEESLEELRGVVQASRKIAPAVEMVGERIIQALQAGNKLLSCGNGGSAADALHLSEELIGRYKVERRPLPSICLNSDVTALTCIGNDYGYRNIFSRQLEGLGKSGDIFVAFTTSGNSENINVALKQAKLMGVTSVVLTGKDGGAARQLADICIIVPSSTTARIQEIHTVILHQWLEQVDALDWNTPSSR